MLNPVTRGSGKSEKPFSGMVLFGSAGLPVPVQKAWQCQAFCEKTAMDHTGPEGFSEADAARDPPGAWKGNCKISRRNRS